MAQTPKPLQDPVFDHLMRGPIVPYPNQPDQTYLYTEQMRQLTQAQLVDAIPTTSNSKSLPQSLHVRARELFLDRMGGVEGRMTVKGGDFLHCFVNAGMVYVFFYFSGKEGVTKEKIELFPSDTLITQFRMILA